jgi:hypothetical protein
MKVLPRATDDMRRFAKHLEGQRTAMLSFADDHGQITARPIGLGEHQIIKASTAVSQTALTR